MRRRRVRYSLSWHPSYRRTRSLDEWYYPLDGTAIYLFSTLCHRVGSDMYRDDGGWKVSIAVFLGIEGDTMSPNDGLLGGCDIVVNLVRGGMDDNKRMQYLNW